MITPAEAAGLVMSGVGTITVPICLFMWSNRKAMRDQLQTKHDENMKNFQVLLYDRQIHPPHTHMETTGPLSAEGIFQRKFNGHD